jgi:phage shock protein PspC (stress-responsive transcriptional regulator)
VPACTSSGGSPDSEANSGDARGVLGSAPVAGICSGIAEYSGLDVTLVRVIVAVVSVLTGGTGALAYLAA